VSEQNQSAGNQPVDETNEGAKPEGSCDDLNAQIEALKAEAATARDQALRAAAEMQNIRRRAEQDVEKAHKFALDRFAGDIVNVADNLERALTTVDKADEKQKAIGEGIELTLKSLVDTLAKHGVQQINPLGEPFNPQQHEAIAMVPNPSMEPNSVMDVMQKGYLLNGRVIRPARVVVTKAP